jgi:hypothetical protein
VRGIATRIETLVPLRETAIPSVAVGDDARTSFEATVRDHPALSRLEAVNRPADETLFSLERDAGRDAFLRGVIDHRGQILDATGSAEAWPFEIRFPAHDRLGESTEYCTDSPIDVGVGRLYNPTKPGNGMWFGLMTAQRRTLVAAVTGGYYSIPRRMSTKDLADRFDISGQAVTERLRRAIVTLTEHTASPPRRGPTTAPDGSTHSGSAVFSVAIETRGFRGDEKVPQIRGPRASEN